MPRRYFEKFPTINYGGYNVRDITVSAKLVNKYVNAPYNYYRYTMDRVKRPDSIASDYYDDPYMSWMVFYANRVVDPYYGWNLSDADFEGFITEKYGSVEVAVRRVKCFVQNWFSDPSELSEAEFFSRFGDYTAPHSKYWEPQYDETSGRLMFYTRKVSDASVVTNAIALVGVDDDVFQTADLVDIVDGSGTLSGSAEVTAAPSGKVYLKDVFGTLASGYTLRSFTDRTVSCTVTSYGASDDTTSAAWTVKNIPDSEYVYWQPYTYYDFESEQNARKSTVLLVDPTLAVRISDRLEEELNE